MRIMNTICICNLHVKIKKEERNRFGLAKQFSSLHQFKKLAILKYYQSLKHTRKLRTCVTSLRELRITTKTNSTLTILKFTNELISRRGRGA